MEYIIESILSVLISAVCVFADSIGTGVMGLLRVDAGTSGSVFNLIFSSMDTFMNVFRVLSLTILFLNLLLQLAKTMLTSAGDESPFSLVVSTVASGIAITFTPRLILIAENLFNQFYNFILGMSAGTTIGWWDMSVTMTNALKAGGSDMHVGDLLLVMLFLLIVIYQFVMFMIEVVERYLVLGVLYFTSPLALSMGGSKSTRPVLASWIRMVLCQMFMMVCNVLFFKMFLMAASSFGTTLGTVFGTLDQKSIVVVWCLILYGILVVGQNMDSYLSTLGLSTAQTGRGLGASIVSSALGVSRAFSLGRAGAGLAIRGGAAAAKGLGKFGSWLADTKVGQAVANSSIGQGAADAYHKVKDTFNRGVQKVKNAGNIGKNLQKDEHGRATAESLGDLFNGDLRKSTKGESIDGRAGGSGFVNAAKDINEERRNMLDQSSFKAHDNGTATMNGADKQGRPFTYTMSSVDALRRAGQDVSKMGGDRFMLYDSQGNPIKGRDGKPMEFVGTASGPGAQSFMTHNPEMQKKMAEFSAQPNCTATTHSKMPGAVVMSQKDPKTGEVISAQMYTPANIYQGDAAMNSHVATEQIGGQTYHVTDVTAAMRQTSRAPGQIPVARGGFSGGAQPTSGPVTGTSQPIGGVPNQQPAAPAQGGGTFGGAQPTSGAAASTSQPIGGVPNQQPAAPAQGGGTFGGAQPTPGTAAGTSQPIGGVPNQQPAAPAQGGGVQSASSPMSSAQSPTMTTFPTGQSQPSGGGSASTTPIGGPSTMQADAVRYMQDAFPELANTKATRMTGVSTAAGDKAFGNAVPNGDSGVITYTNQIDGKMYAMAPSIEYGLNPSIRDAKTVLASNKAPYVQVPIDQNTDLSQVFFRRSAQCMPQQQNAPAFDTLVAPDHANKLAGAAKERIDKTGPKSSSRRSGGRNNSRK